MILHTEELRSIRKSQRLTIKELANKLEIARSTMSDWENGIRIPNEKKIRNIARVLNIPPSAISDINTENIISDLNLVIRDENDYKVHNDKIRDIQKSILSIDTLITENDIILKALKRITKSLIYVKCKNQKFILINDTFLKATKFSLSTEIGSKSDFDFFSNQEAEKNSKEDKKVIETRCLLTYEGYIPGTRKSRWGIITKQPMLDDNGLTLGMICTITDITERREAETNISILVNTLDSLNYAVSIRTYSPDKRIYMNKGYKNIYGYDPSEIIEGSLWIESIHKDDYKEVYKYYIEQQWPEELTFRIVTKDKKVKKIKQFYHTTIINSKKYHLFIEEDITEEESNKIILEKTREAISEDGNNIAQIVDSKKITSNSPFLYISQPIADILGVDIRTLEKKPLFVLKYITKEEKTRIRSFLNTKSYPAEIMFTYNHPLGKSKKIRIVTQYSPKGYYFNTLYDMSNMSHF